MTYKERISLEKLHHDFEDYVKKDMDWKADFNKWRLEIVEPVIKKDAEAKVINAYKMKLLKYFVAIVSFLVTVGLLFHYVIAPLLHIN